MAIREQATSGVTLPRPSDGTPAAAGDRRVRVRRIAIALSLGIAVLYGLIAAAVVTVIDGPASEVASEQLSFALPAAAVHVVGAGLLWRFDRRLLWTAGAVLQTLIIVMYFAVAPQRDPAFELWGIAIRALQFGLLAALVWLAVRPVRAT